MIGKCFLLALVCVSLTQVQGDELENAIKKGLIKVEALYKRGVARIDHVQDQSQVFESKTAAFIETIQRIQQSSRTILRNGARKAEERAKASQKPESVFKCISEAETSANDRVQTFTAKFQSDLKTLETTYMNKAQLAAKPLATHKKELNSRYERTVVQVQACKTTECVETAVNNYAVFTERFFQTVETVQTQIRMFLNNFQREARTAFNNANREIGGIKSDGLRRIRACVYNRDALVR